MTYILFPPNETSNGVDFASDELRTTRHNLSDSYLLQQYSAQAAEVIKCLDDNQMSKIYCLGPQCDTVTDFTLLAYSSYSAPYFPSKRGDILVRYLREKL